MSFKNTLTRYLGYVMFKELRFVKINSVNLLYLITDKINWYSENIGKSNLIQMMIYL